MIQTFLKNHLDVGLDALEIEMTHLGVAPTTQDGGLIHPVVYHSNTMSLLQGVWHIVMCQANAERLSSVMSPFGRIDSTLDFSVFDDQDIRMTEVQLAPDTPPVPLPIWVTRLGAIVVGVPMVDIGAIYEAIGKATEATTSNIILNSDNIIPLR